MNNRASGGDVHGRQLRVMGRAVPTTICRRNGQCQVVPLKNLEVVPQSLPRARGGRFDDGSVAVRTRRRHPVRGNQSVHQGRTRPHA